MTGTGRWVVISDYPTWPSPYFAELERHAPPRLRLEFASHLEDLDRRPAGVVNLHRLKRLYREPDGSRTLAAAETMLARLTALRRTGWRVVWTVHNLFPIDGGPPTEADRHAAYGVLRLADAVIAHTRADARHLDTLTRAPVIVAGWAGLTAGTSAVPPKVRALAARIAAAPVSMLMLGNLTAYKGLATAVRAFASHTRAAHLFVVGPAREDVAEFGGTDRVHFHLERIPPEHAHVLYRAADAALCPYRTDGPWEFFTRVLHPSSVGTAVAFGTPVIAPDLPAVAEMTGGHPRWLYPPDTGPGPALALAEVEATRVPRHVVDGARRWWAVLAAYEQLAQDLLAGGTVRSPQVAREAGTRQRRPRPISNKETRQVSGNATDRIASVLADRYGLAVQDLVQLPIGQGTINYRATCADREVFVKNYPSGTDLRKEAEAVQLSELAHRHGIPAATALRNRSGQVIDATTLAALSVWEWMPGQVVTELSTAQYEQAGHALGRIHALFAGLPASATPSPEAEKWRHVDLSGLVATIDTLLGVIARRAADGLTDAFDIEAERTLTERRAMLPGIIPKLLTELPRKMTTQVLHGDYSPVNLLFTGDTLSAVLDFRPPEPFLLAYDLGRMAFYPNTVTGDPHWQDAARTLITAYRTTNPAVPEADIRTCGRVALLQLLGSLYGVKQHYLKPGLFQDDLDEFWLTRHRTADTMLRYLPETDALLEDLTTRPPYGLDQQGEP
ncbi:phosphotransferase [Microbispora sp. NBC_01189]|uniref:phosphotransferase n=1 Tax=Microbispora sp. NBC_01189 TaxID=2903583 RepID=UPI002E16138E|nr:phosphotransferase [Microbispora sp. NBC_01189]